MQASPAGFPRLSVWMTASAALFFLLTLSVPNGYSWGAGLLLAGALAGLWQRRLAQAPHAAHWSIQDRTLCVLLTAVFLMNAVAVAWHGDEGKYLDQGVRYLLVIPVVWGLRRVRLRMDWLWAGLALGCMGAAGVAWWQIHRMEFNRASGFITSAIPFGDMALIMAFWCLLGAALMAIRHRLGWTALLLAGSLAGVYAFIASATRGGLVALPIMIILAAVVLIRREHVRVVLVGCGLLIVAITLAFTLLTAGQIAEGRFGEALSEWQAYSQQGDATNNVGSRLEAWKAALISIPDRPLLGWSYTDYDAHLQTLIQAGRVKPFVGTLSNTHNQFLEVWLHQGTLGLMALLALLIASFWYFAQRLRHADVTVRVLACCGASLPAAFAAFGLTQVILGRNNGVMFFVVSLAIWWAAMRGEE
ncbi:O-antigen ligase family protein [Castellaniella sp. MT123]|uniref:O-antigen ligase family protein n=1 Tax=Castellaniella sp. MT123 TaxID=3140381 RepID=UPI0031F4731C